MNAPATSWRNRRFRFRGTLQFTTILLPREMHSLMEFDIYVCSVSRPFYVVCRGAGRASMRRVGSWKDRSTSSVTAARFCLSSAVSSHRSDVDSTFWKSSTCAVSILMHASFICDVLIVPAR